jgi:hypothetical protein
MDFIPDWQACCLLAAVNPATPQFSSTSDTAEARYAGAEIEN